MINRYMDPAEAMAECEDVLFDLLGYDGIDYEKAEHEYGRLPGADGLVRNIGLNCLNCPVFTQQGQCDVRDAIQELAAEHREKLDHEGLLIGTSVVPEADYAASRADVIDRKFESGWSQPEVL